MSAGENSDVGADLPGTATSPDPGLGTSAICNQLGAGLAALSSERALSQLRPPDPAGRAGTPAKSRDRPVTASVERAPSAAALAVADRLLALAGVARPAPSDNRARESLPAPVVAVSPFSPPSLRPTSPPPVGCGAESEAEPTVVRGTRGGAAVVLRAADGRSWDLTAGQSLTIGRDGHVSTIVIDDPAVSRRHVLVSLDAGGVTATDLGSTNGTTIVRDGLWRDLAAQVPTALAPGDWLAVPDDTWLIAVSTAEPSP